MEPISLDIQFLFRGISVATHESGTGLSPKGTGFTRTIHLDEPDLRLDMGLTLDDSIENAIVTHQLDSGYYRSAGVSTTPHFERAKYYATQGGTREGVVYRIDRRRLDSHGVCEHVVADYVPHRQCPEHEEIILVHYKHGPLPSAIVIAVTPVQP